MPLVAVARRCTVYKQRCSGSIAMDGLLYDSQSMWRCVCAASTFTLI
jgi:hypothetical protein